MSNPAKSESSNSGICSDPNGVVESSSGTDLVLFTVVECEAHGYHVVMWTPEIDPE